MSKKTRYGEGDWFSVPLRSGGFGIGLIARASSSGILLGYFFGVKTSELPTKDDCVGLSSTDASLVARFGDLGLKRGVWLLIGRDTDWDREKWPVPVFIRYEQLSGRTFHVFYDDVDPQLLIGEQQVPPGSLEQGPSNDLFGAGAVEKALTKILG